LVVFDPTLHRVLIVEFPIRFPIDFLPAGTEPPCHLSTPIQLKLYKSSVVLQTSLNGIQTLNLAVFKPTASLRTSESKLTLFQRAKLEPFFKTGLESGKKINRKFFPVG